MWPSLPQFGNYIGPELGDDDSDAGDEGALGGAAGDQWEDHDDEGRPARDDAMDEGADADADAPAPLSGSHALVLHEDKQYYPNASDVYPGAEILVEEEDTQPLETPLVAPVKTKTYEAVEHELPATTFSFEYMTGLMDHPTFARNLAVVGYGHGRWFLSLPFPALSFVSCSFISRFHSTTCVIWRAAGTCITARRCCWICWCS